eukprot:13274090-Alexandrium_andersonii.AAC.1
MDVEVAGPAPDEPMGQQEEAGEAIEGGPQADLVASPATPAESEAEPAPKVGALSFTVSSDMRVAKLVDNANMHAGTIIEVTSSQGEGAHSRD